MTPTTAPEGTVATLDHPDGPRFIVKHGGTWLYAESSEPVGDADPHGDWDAVT